MTTIVIPELDAILASPPRNATWTEEMDAILRTYYPALAAARRVAALKPHLDKIAGRGISVCAIRLRAEKLGLQGRGA
ncbi:MAG: hypothetical protein MUE60_16565 [Candidatus Eisenbacteria bacterium]|jgi:hypothetical protein|nr:hypothetical protein [Candidatus Eisenbacteria bacterium]